MGSHTSTGEWQSFEARMRRRRAERLALRAALAAEAGCLDEAHACLEEARRLAPALPDCARVEQKLRGTTPVAPAVRRTSRFPARTLSAAAALLVIASAAATITVAGPSPITPTREFRLVTTLVVDDRPSPVSFDLKAEAVPLPVASVSKPTPEIPLPPVAPAILRTSDNAAVTGANPVRTIALEVPAGPTATTERSDAAPPAVPLPEPPAAIAAPAPRATATDPSEDVLVRSTLDRYAAAYSALDAGAAERVWPRVNRGALSRAFETLASQQVSLGDCRVDVAGASARAICAGSATWAPKVGAGSPRTDPRRWDFELARIGDGWQIVNARVQNR